MSETSSEAHFDNEKESIVSYTSTQVEPGIHAGIQNGNNRENGKKSSTISKSDARSVSSDDRSEHLERLLKETHQTVSNRDVFIAMLQKQLKKIEDLYKKTLDQQQDLRQKYASVMLELSQLKIICEKLKDENEALSQSNDENVKRYQREREALQAEVDTWKQEYDQLLKSIDNMENSTKTMKTILSSETLDRCGKCLNSDNMRMLMEQYKQIQETLNAQNDKLDQFLDRFRLIGDGGCHLVTSLEGMKCINNNLSNNICTIIGEAPGNIRIDSIGEVPPLALPQHKGYRSHSLPSEHDRISSTSARDEVKDATIATTDGVSQKKKPRTVTIASQTDFSPAFYDRDDILLANEKDLQTDAIPDQLYGFIPSAIRPIQTEALPGDSQSPITEAEKRSIYSTTSSSTYPEYNRPASEKRAHTESIAGSVGKASVPRDSCCTSDATQRPNQYEFTQHPDLEDSSSTRSLSVSTQTDTKSQDDVISEKAGKIPAQPLPKGEIASVRGSAHTEAEKIPTKSVPEGETASVKGSAQASTTPTSQQDSGTISIDRASEKGGKPVRVQRSVSDTFVEPVRVQRSVSDTFAKPVRVQRSVSDTEVDPVRNKSQVMPKRCSTVGWISPEKKEEFAQSYSAKPELPVAVAEVLSLDESAQTGQLSTQSHRSNQLPEKDAASAQTEGIRSEDNVSSTSDIVFGCFKRKKTRKKEKAVDVRTNDACVCTSDGDLAPYYAPISKPCRESSLQYDTIIMAIPDTSDENTEMEAHVSLFNAPYTITYQPNAGQYDTASMAIQETDTRSTNTEFIPDESGGGDLATENNELRQQLEDKNNEIEELKRARSLLSMKAKEGKDMADGNADQLLSEKQLLLDENSALKQVINRFQADVQNLEEELEEAQKRAALSGDMEGANVQDLNQKHANALLEIENLEEEKSTLTGQIAKLNDAIKQYKEQASLSELEMAKMNDKIALLENTINDLEERGEFDAINKDVDGAKADLLKLQTRYDELKDERDKLIEDNKELYLLKKEASKLKWELDSKDDMVNDLQQCIEELGKELEQASLSKPKPEVAKLMEKAALLENTIKDLEERNEFDAINGKDVDSLKADLRKLQTRYDELKDERDKLVDDNKELYLLKKETSKLKWELDSKDDILNDLQQRKMELEKALEQASLSKLELAKLMEKAALLENTIKDLEERKEFDPINDKYVESLKADLRKLQTRYDVPKDERDKLVDDNKEVHLLKKETAKLKWELDSKDDMLNDLQQRIVELEKELEQAFLSKLEVAKLMEKIALLEDTIKELEERNEFDAINGKDVDSLKADLRKLQTRYDVPKHERDKLVDDNKEVHPLKKDTAKFKRELDSKDDMVKDLQQRIIELKKELEQASLSKLEVAKLMEKAALLENTIKDLEERNEFDAINSKYVDSLKADLRKLQTRYGVPKDERDKLVDDNKEVHPLKKDTAKFKRELDSKDDMVKDLQQRIMELKKELEQASLSKLEVAKLMEKATLLANTIKDLEERNEFDAINSKYVDSLKADLSKLQTRYGVPKDERDKLVDDNKEVHLLKKETAKFKRELDSKDDMVNDLQQRIVELEKELEQASLCKLELAKLMEKTALLEDTIKELEERNEFDAINGKDVHSLKAALRKLQIRYDVLKDERDKLVDDNKELYLLKKETSKLKWELDSKDDMVDDLQQRKVELEKELEQAYLRKLEAAKLMDKIALLENTIKELEERNKFGGKDVDSLKADLRKLQTRYDVLKDERDKLVDDNKEVYPLKKKASNLKWELDTKDVLINDLRQHNAELEKELEQASRFKLEVAKWTEKIALLEKIIKALEGRNKSPATNSTDGVKCGKAQLQKLQTQYDALKDERDKFKADLYNLQTRYDDIKDEHDKLVEDNKEVYLLKKKTSNLIWELDTKDVLINDLRQHIAELEKELVTMREEVLHSGANAKREMDMLIDSCTELEQKLQTTKEILAKGSGLIDHEVNTSSCHLSQTKELERKVAEKTAEVKKLARELEEVKSNFDREFQKLQAKKDLLEVRLEREQEEHQRELDMLDAKLRKYVNAETTSSSALTSQLEDCVCRNNEYKDEVQSLKDQLKEMQNLGKEYGLVKAENMKLKSQIQILQKQLNELKDVEVKMKRLKQERDDLSVKVQYLETKLTNLNCKCGVEVQNNKPSCVVPVRQETRSCQSSRTSPGRTCENKKYTVSTNVTVLCDKFGKVPTADCCTTPSSAASSCNQTLQMRLLSINRMEQQVDQMIMSVRRQNQRMNDSAYSRARSDKEIDARISQLRQQREKIMCNLTCFKKELTAYESKTKDCCSSNMIRKT